MLLIKINAFTMLWVSVWQFGLVVVCWSRTVKLLYVMPSWSWIGELSSGQTISICNWPPRPTQPVHPSAGRHNE